MSWLDLPLRLLGLPWAPGKQGRSVSRRGPRLAPELLGPRVVPSALAGVGAVLPGDMVQTRCPPAVPCPFPSPVAAFGPVGGDDLWVQYGLLEFPTTDSVGQPGPGPAERDLSSAFSSASEMDAWISRLAVTAPFGLLVGGVLAGEPIRELLDRAFAHKDRAALDRLKKEVGPRVLQALRARFPRPSPDGLGPEAFLEQAWKELPEQGAPHGKVSLVPDVEELCRRLLGLALRLCIDQMEQRIGPWVLAMLRGRFPQHSLDGAGLEDCLQQAWKEFWDRWATTEEPLPVHDLGEFRRFLLTIAERRCIDARRRAQRLSPTAPGDFPATGPDGFHPEAGEKGEPHRQLEQGELRDRLEGALQRLPAELREVVHLRFVEGEKLAAVGRRLGLSTTTVHNREQRALRLLRDDLARAGF